MTWTGGERIGIVGTSALLLEELVVPRELAARLRRADDFTRLGVVAAHQALPDHWKVSDAMAAQQHGGVFVGSAYGPMQTNFDVLELIVSGQQVSPTLFSHSVFNGAAGYIATCLGLTGMSQTLTDFDLPFFQALREACLALRSGAVSRCLVVQIETYSQLLADGWSSQCRERDEPGKAWPAGAVCLALERCEPGGSGRPALSCPDIGFTVQDVDRQLTADICCDFGTMTSGGRELGLDHPLAAAQLFVTLVSSEAGSAGVRIGLRGRWGDMRLDLSAC